MKSSGEVHSATSPAVRLGIGMCAVVALVAGCAEHPSTTAGNDAATAHAVPAQSVAPSTSTSSASTSTTGSAASSSSSTATSSQRTSSKPEPRPDDESEAPSSQRPSAQDSLQEAVAEEPRSTTNRSSGALQPRVEAVYKEFQSLAPRSLFEQFDTCAPNGVPDSAACSGAEVGQFQFFKSDTKAASTTQLLTELRSSRVVEDTGNKVVGWTTLGSMSIVTVVDNQRGLVLQQMISSDSQDPKALIYKLGLAEQTTGQSPDH